VCSEWQKHSYKCSKDPKDLLKPVLLEKAFCGEWNSGLCNLFSVTVGACTHPCALGMKLNKKTFRVSLSCGEKCTLVALLIFAMIIFKMWSFFLGYAVFTCMCMVVFGSRARKSVHKDLI
jgi:hypothetical protein